MRFPLTAIGVPRDELDRDQLGLVRRILRRGGEHEQVRRRRSRGILEHAAFVRQVPDVRVARVDLLLGRGNGNSASRGVRDRVLAAADVPLAPRRDDRKLRREAGVCQLEADLIVALPGAAVSQRIGTDAAGDLDLPLGDQRSRHRRAEQVLAVVDGARPERGEDEVAHELVAQILDEAFGRRRRRVPSHKRLPAPRHPDRCRRPRKSRGRRSCSMQPRNDDGGVEPARIGKHNGAGHSRCSLNC